ncbi:DUF1003 domain-containing protein [Pseudonocardia petroleophila]|uniref:DUF1003 domain-containing protein n=1 Tax=Pseudonocardia petroleophila TaxID=37331 RepID=A0A7G7MF06_9PSEU|nr:DUF1003 domain-containing protein [Pseudonocardia petroleophila]QNG51367.1 DUF1003 domain-containing protein [Pseudonocardia petroleophila]
MTASRSGWGPHPVVAAQRAHRAAHLQLRVADGITAFAGSMPFVYLHTAVFAVWMLLVESSPWPTLTLVVSLEAIFLSTFVMIGQNRQAAFQQAKATHDFVEQELELRTNTDITRAIHVLTAELHRRLLDDRPTPSEEPFARIGTAAPTEPSGDAAAGRNGPNPGVPRP